MSYHGPVLVPTREEAALTLALLRRHDGSCPAEAASLKAKCERVLASDPKWREPTT